MNNQKLIIVIQKLITIIFILLAYFLLESCQPSVRFASNRQNNDSSLTGNSEKNDTKNVSNVKKNAQQTTYYDKPAKIIYPTNKINKYSNKLMSIAELWIGVPYLYGGNTRQGIDCSGFVKNVYSEIGINLPRTSGEQFIYTIPTNTPTVGDLVFFKKKDRISHVGIYIGNNSIIHASINKGVVIEAMKGNHLEKTFVGYGRVNFS
jgi:cell wall-associated NlpC family hydrolase